jgi:hypothetical protein
VANPWFSPELLSFLDGFDGKSKWHIEGFGHPLVIYRRGKRVKPEDFSVFSQETAEIAKKFFSPAG